MDFNQAILFGQLIGAAYDVPATDLTNRAGSVIPAGQGPLQTDFTVITSLYTNDLSTDVNKLRAEIPVTIGLVLQSAAGDAVVAIRGTEGIFEWIHDAAFLPVPCPFLSSAGNTEDGFTAMYRAMSIAVTPGSPSVTSALPSLPWKKKPINSLTICGHSLGGALATLLALDVAAHSTDSVFKSLVSYTYASPRTGDSTFANVYNRVVPMTFRIANRLDLVPKLPLPPLYEHVNTLIDLNPVKLFPPQALVKFEIPCEHFLTSYLHLLSLQAGAATLPLDPACVPAAGVHLPTLH